MVSYGLSLGARMRQKKNMHYPLLEDYNCYHCHHATTTIEPPLHYTNYLRNQLLLSPLIRLVLENDDKCRKHALLAFQRASEIKDTPHTAAI